MNSVTRIGEVYSVSGRNVKVLVDANKNDSHLLFKGSLLKNVSVGSFIKIAKGFVRIIGKVEGEYNNLDKELSNDEYHSSRDVIRRYLEVKLLGYIDFNSYKMGIKEMPLIGNECFLLIDSEFRLIHRFAKSYQDSINIGTLLMDDSQDIRLGINELFTGHIGIFGNTGSGKSYTLAQLYHQLYIEAKKYPNFNNKARFIIFDFNGEYSTDASITESKRSYKLSTRDSGDGNKIQIGQSDIFKPELVSILANATEKTQQPFIRRALKLYSYVFKQQNQLEKLREIICDLLVQTLKFRDSVKGNHLIAYIEQILLLGYKEDDGKHQEVEDFFGKLGYFSKDNCFYVDINGNRSFFDNADADNKIKRLQIYLNISSYMLCNNSIDRIILFMLIQLSKDLLYNRVVNEHVAPAINKLKAHKTGFEKIFDIKEEEVSIFDDTNLVVIDMNNVSTDMKKLIPMILSQKLYNEHKIRHEADKRYSLHLVIDEAHNILSYESVRESETWKDYRLETFEEIIKEGRKFGVFLTIASQRPSDISHTIISQLHNFFIHRLVNQKDIDMIGNSVSYLDKLSIEQLPNLPTGGCVVAGVMTQLPVLIQIKRLDQQCAPDSSTIDLVSAWTTGENK